MRAIIFPLLLLLIFSITCLETASAQTPSSETVLAPGNPPLTSSIVGKNILLMQWALDIQLSDDQMSTFAKAVVGLWKANNQSEMKDVVLVAGMVDELSKATPDERNRAKTAIRAKLLENMRNYPTNEVNRMLLQIYEASQKGNSAIVSPSGNAPATAKSRSRVGADGFTGIYRMVRPRALNINSSVAENGYTIEYITFLPDGHVYWTLPPEGLLYFDPAVAQRADPDDWGTYEIVGNEIRIIRGPNRYKYVMPRNGERLENPTSLGRGSFRPVPPADGLRLEGNYRRDSSEPTITFTRDGSFRDGGIFRYFGTMQRPNGTVYQDDGVGGTGTYLIEQNTLELRYSDGRIKRFPFIAFPENLAKKPAVDSFILRYEETMKRY